MKIILSQLKTFWFICLIALLPLFGVLPANHVQAQSVAEYHQRADALLENYLLKYWDGNYIRNTGEWTYIHGMDAVIDGAERTNKQKYYGLIETFYEAQDRRHGWLNDYYDDENWFVLTLIHAYDVTGNKKYLSKAEEIYADIQNTAWDDSCCGKTKGGLWWDKAHTQKATAANAGAVISGLKLYKRTNKDAYRDFAKKVYNFWWENMVNKTTYQVADHLNPDGTKVWWKFTYNEGLMIGASVEMYNIYQKPSYLSNAHNVAGFMVNNETVETAYGKVLSDGAQCSGDCEQFKGPGYRYLMQLYLVDKKAVYHNVLKASVEALWNLARTSDNSVGVNWAGSSTSSTINDRTQNAAAQAMSLFAKQSSAYPASNTPGQYEAENATIRGVVLEANQPGYSGWGFLGGWQGDGKFVKFEVNNTTAGNKVVTLKYAAAAGDASRNISINGKLVRNLRFPNTGGWNQYATTSFIYDFPAGTSTIQIDYQSNYLNFDNITLSEIQPLPVTNYHQQADALLENYLLRYWDGNYIRNTGEWTYIHGMDAVIDGAERTNKQKYYGLIETFYEAQDTRHGWLNDYYDDENWFVLTLVHAYDVTGNKKYLDKAEEIYADIQNTAWDNTCCGETKGGLWWNKEKTQKATAANAGAVISGLQLFKRTNKVAYRDFAKQVYDFWWANMVNKTTYQVADHIKPDGTKVWWKFTYNEGLMIGASVEMYTTYQETSYLSNAHNVAGFMVNNEIVETAYGKVLSDGNETSCTGDCEQFKGPGYRYLMQLYLLDKKDEYYKVLKTSVDAIAHLARTPDNSVGVNWEKTSASSAVNDRTQNAAAQAMSLFAKQNSAYPVSNTPPGQYEAENATIRGILFEANQPGYSGWGFLGGWMGTGKSVKFEVNNTTAGTKVITLRYAADAGDAYRNISVNGIPVTNLRFPNTGGWNKYATTSFTYVFPAGTSTMLVDYSANYLNLDNITISDAPQVAQQADPTTNMQVYPNPVQSGDKLHVNLRAEQPMEVNLQIADLFGQNLLDSKKQVQKGMNTLQMPLDGLQKGTYLLSINHGTHRETKRIVVK